MPSLKTRKCVSGENIEDRKKHFLIQAKITCASGTKQLQEIKKGEMKNKIAIFH